MGTKNYTPTPVETADLKRAKRGNRRKKNLESTKKNKQDISTFFACEKFLPKMNGSTRFLSSEYYLRWNWREETC